MILKIIQYKKKSYLLLNKIKLKYNFISKLDNIFFCFFNIQILNSKIFNY